MKAISLWSGGKDSCFACYKAIQQGHEVVSLFNFTDTGSRNSLSHGLPFEAIHKQITMTGFPFLQKAMPKVNYRQEFKSLIEEWKEKQGIEGIVFGDIYLEEHKDWIDKVCEELAIKPIMPLWKNDTADLINEIIEAGFKAMVVATNAKYLGKEWLGRQIDKEFIEDLSALRNIDLCGEKGEFHTFVYDGPLFKEKVKFNKGNKISRDDRWFLEIL
ncbi:MAG: diphthine--ammonia ligase [Candidatus Omnitrophica bacterium]|nr:diphthine--ammonia ligase [Candidatus Omnitrophota bacterium]